MAEFAALAAILEAALQPEKMVRTHAEVDLEGLATQPGFFLALCNYVCTHDAAVPLRLRLISVSVCKKHLPQCSFPDEVVEVIRRLRHSLRAEDDKRMAGLVSSTLRSITPLLIQESGGSGAHAHDCEEQLQGMLTDIASGLGLGSSHQQQRSSLLLLSELLGLCAEPSCSGELAGSILMALSTVVGPLVELAYGDAQTEDTSIQALASTTVKDVVHHFLCVKAQSSSSQPLKESSSSRQIPIAARLAASSLGEAFCSATSAAIGRHLHHVVARATESCRDRSSVTPIVEALSTLLDVLCDPQLCASVATTNTVAALLNSLQHDACYAAKAAECDSDEDQEVVRVAARRWSALSTLLAQKRFGNLVERAIASDLGAFAHLCMCYTVVSSRKVLEWEVDANAFLVEEGEREDELLWSARDIAAGTCTVAVKCLGAPFLRVLLGELHAVLSHPLGPGGFEATAVGACIAEVEAVPVWKYRECVLFLLEHLVRERWAVMKRLGLADPTRLLESLMAVDVRGPPVLASRALSLLAATLQKMKKDGNDVAPYISTLLPLCIDSLSHGQPLLRACSCRLLFRMLTYAAPGAGRAVFIAGFDKTMAMACAQCTHSDILYLTIETLHMWLRNCGSEVNDLLLEPAGVTLAESPEKLVALWRRHIQDPNVGELVLDVFTQFLKAPALDASVCNCFPWMRSVIQGHATMAEFCAVPCILQVLSEVFRVGSNAVASAAATAVVGSLCSMLLTTEESSIITSATNCLAQLLDRCPQPAHMTVLVPTSAIQAAFRHRATEGSDARLPEHHAESPTGAAAAVASPLPSLIPLDEQSTPHPLTTVLVAISITVLATTRGEVALMSIGHFLTAVAHHATSFDSHEMQHWIVTLVVRLSTVRTATVFQELIVPIAILLERHQAALLHVLQSAGQITTLFGRWLPRIKSFDDTTALCAVTSSLLSLLETWPASLNGEMILWKDPDQQRKRPPVLPLPVAVFAALCNALLLIDEENASDTDADDSDTYSDATDDESATIQHAAPGYGPPATTSTPQHPNIDHYVQRIKPYVAAYTAQTQTLFNSAQRASLAELLT